MTFDYSDKAYRAFSTETNRSMPCNQRSRFFAKSWSHGKVLEIGCGDNPVFEDSVHLDIAKNLSGKYINADCNKPFATKLGQKFDTIMALELIEHLYNPDMVLSESRELLNDEGHLILSTPNVKYWRNRLQLLLGSDRWFDTQGLHYFFFSSESLTRLLEKHGFKVVRMLSNGKIPFLSLCGGFVVLAGKRR